MKDKPNEILAFLEGRWVCEDRVFAPGRAPVVHRYEETIAIKDTETLSITAEGLKDTPITKDMSISVAEGQVTMGQGDFTATGKIHGNRVLLFNDGYLDRQYEIRLYLMGDTYLYHMDTLKEGDVITSQTSYLKRKS